MREWLATENVDEIIFSDFPSENQDSLNNFIHFLGDYPIPIRYTPHGEILLWASKVNILEIKFY